MSLALQTAMRISCVLKKLLKKLNKNIRAPNGRAYVSKILIKLPRTLFPTFRVIVNPVIIETNRKTLNFYSDNTFNESFSTEFYDSLSSSGEESTFVKRPPKISQKSKKNPSALGKCCRHCLKLYYPQNNAMDGLFQVISLIETPQTKIIDPQNVVLNATPKLSNKIFENHQNIMLDAMEPFDKDSKPPQPVINPLNYSTPIKLWSEEVEQELEGSKINGYVPPPPPMPLYDFFNMEEDEVVSNTPLRRVTVGDIQSVKLKPPSMPLTIPKTPEVHDMMAVLRKRFAAMHSPLFDDVTMTSSDSEADLSDFYSDFSNNMWQSHNKYQVGVV